MAKYNSTRLFAVSAVIALSGCATCERHPVECGVVVGIVATSIAISVNQHHDYHGAMPPATTQIPQTPTGPTTY